jgi:GNAT superfamily N-acetyltransferase
LDASDADEEIANQIDYFSSRGLSFVWRVYDTDLPSDLVSRLERAGFHLDSTSELMIAEVTDVVMDVDLPTDVYLSTENGQIAIDRLIEVHEKVFGIDHSQLRRSLLAQFSSSPELSELVVAMTHDGPIASSRVEFLPDREFASLWGGSTLPEWRGKGLFQAMVAHRAREAAKRGYTYIYVTASAESRPILERISFDSFGRVWTYRWQP